MQLMSKLLRSPPSPCPPTFRCFGRSAQRAAAPGVIRGQGRGASAPPSARDLVGSTRSCHGVLCHDVMPYRVTVEPLVWRDRSRPISAPPSAHDPGGSPRRRSRTRPSAAGSGARTSAPRRGGAASRGGEGRKGGGRKGEGRGKGGRREGEGKGRQKKRNCACWFVFVFRRVPGGKQSASRHGVPWEMACGAHLCGGVQEGSREAVDSRPKRADSPVVKFR